MRNEDAAEWVTAHELLARTVFYKVGHHGSHNATLRALGLELMTNEDQNMKVDELNSRFASYLPDRCLITFSPAMRVFSKDDLKPRGFRGIREISYFFHEWMHYLHNVSTVHGVASFASLVEIWNAFRWTTDERGMSSGKIDYESPELFRVRELMIHLEAARKNGEIWLPKGTRPEDVEIVGHSGRRTEVEGGASTHLLSMFYSNRLGDKNHLEVVLGPGEILESVAYLLEKIFLDRLAEDRPDPAEVVPYHLLSVFARYVSPSLSEEDVLLCGLACLQCTDPVELLTQLLVACEQRDKADGARSELIELAAIRQVRLASDTVPQWLDRMEGMFPKDESMGLAVKEAVGYMRGNFEARKSRPFFELDFIEEIRSEGVEGFDDLMNRLMKAHGICSGKQEGLGFPDDVRKDTLFDFAIAGQDQDLLEARRVMQASFDFVMRHFSIDGEFVPTSSAKKKACPFYTSCDLPTRIDRQEDCRTQPWMAVESSPDAACWYAQGVLQLRPGEIAESTPEL